MTQKQALLLGASVLAGLLASLAPHLAFLAAGGALVYNRERAAGLLWRFLQDVPGTQGPDGRAVPGFRPGRHLCLVVVWTAAGWCFVVALYSII